jgi:nicotinamidase-related amidase
MQSNKQTMPPNFFRDRGFGGGMGYGSQPALIVVDFMYGFTDPTLPLGSDCSEAIDQANLLIDAAHEAAIPVFFTAIQYDDAALNDAGLWPRKIGGLSSLASNTGTVEQDGRLHRIPSDMILVKKYASSFFGTDLSSRLQALRVDTVLIAGVSTSGCVRATAVDACQHGFRTIVVREACADRSKPAHEQSLVDIETKYGDVVSVEGAVKYLAEIKAAS